MCKGMLGSSSLNGNTIMVAAQGVRRTEMSSMVRDLTPVLPKISFQLDVILNIALALVGIRYAPL